MLDIEQVRTMALALPDVEELPHFEKASFRWRNKIFSTLKATEHKAMVFLSPVDQSVFCAFDTSVFYPVPGAWGAKGCTFVDLKKVHPDMFQDALHCAYQNLLNKNSGKGKARV